jgi:UDP-glucose 4-epimerase
MTEREVDAAAKLPGRRLLVTGAAGFIGAQICRHAMEHGAVVHGVSRRPPEDGALAPAHMLWETCDVTDIGLVRATMRRVEPDIVLHLASEVSGARDLDHVLPMLHANLVAAVNVMVAAGEAGCPRVVLAGSMEEPDPGDADAVAQSPYAAAKSGAHAYARMFHALYGLPVVHLRIFMVYGPAQRDLRKLIPYVTTSLLSGERPLLMSGERNVDWVYVDDVVDGFLRAATADRVEGRSFDIGSGELVSVRSVVERLTRLVGGAEGPSFGALADRRLERVRVADPAAADEAMGWRPRVPLDEGLARTVDHYRRRVGVASPA